MIHDSSKDKTTDTDLQSANFVMELLSGKLTQVAVKTIMAATNVLIKKAIENTLEEASEMLRVNGCSHSSLIDDMRMENQKATMNLFQHVRDQHNQTIFFKEHFGMIMPKKIKLPFLPNNFGRVCVGKDQEFYTNEFVVVSLLEQIEQLLNIPDIYEMIFNPKANNLGTI